MTMAYLTPPARVLKASWMPEKGWKPLSSAHLRDLLALFVAAALPALAAAAPFAYVSNSWSADVSVVDLASNSLITTIPVVAVPIGVAVNSAGTRAYIANSVMFDGLSRISVIDTATNTVVQNVPAGFQAYGVALNPSEARLYITNAMQDANSVSVMDTTTNTIVATVPVGSFPMGVTVNAAGTRVYVANNGSDTVSVIDAATNTVIATVPVGIGARGIAINGAGTRVYVTNQNDNTVAVIDTSSLARIATVPVGNSPTGIAVQPDGTSVYVANEMSNSVSIIDASSNAVVTTVAVPSVPKGIAFDPSGARAYVVSYGADQLSAIDTASRTVVSSVAVGLAPFAFGQFIQPPSLTAGSPLQAKDLAFTPVPPCRLVDTRSAAWPLQPRTARGFSSSVSAQIAAAGGNTAGCNIPNGAAALALTITAVAPAQVGNLVAYSAGTAAPLASSLNFLGGQTIANTTVVPITSGTGDNFALLNNSDGATNVVVDAVGYFWESAAADCTKVSQPQAIGSGSTAAVAATCSTGFVPVGGGCSVNAANAVTWLDRRNTANGAGYNCRAMNRSAGAVIVTTDVLCCRKAGR